MCGIALIFGYAPDAPPTRREELIAIRDSMIARGPDGAGAWIHPRGHVGLAHRRLAIIDPTEAAAQPMQSGDGKLVVTFNGELYNYRELRSELQRRGHEFRTSSDTEVLLAGYREHGEQVLQHLRGMFAFAIWDEARGAVFLGRDHFGIKPLYVHERDGVVRAASRVRALLAGGAIESRDDVAGQVGFLLWGAVPEPYTTVRDVRSLPAGSSVWIDERGMRGPRRYFDLVGELARAETETASASARLRGVSLLADVLRDSVEHHLIADVPVGVFLSAGLDSSTITALAAARGGGAHAITLGFTEFAGTPADEVPIARATADFYGCRHSVSLVARDDFEDELATLLGAMDQPSIDGVNTYFVARATKRAGLRVALSGVGGDELFAGYSSFRQIPTLVSVASRVARVPAVAHLWQRLVSRFASDHIPPKAPGLIEYGKSYGGAYLLRRALFMPWELPAILGPEIARAGLDELNPVERLDQWLTPLRSPRARVMAAEMGCYMQNTLLRDADWAGMAHSVEIRTPFVDVEVFRRLASSIVGPPFLEKADLLHVPRRPLPDAVVRRPKTGFAIPVAEWQRASSSSGEPLMRGLRSWALQVFREMHRVGGVSS